MLTALCACGFFTNPHVPIIDPIEALGRIASLFVGGVISPRFFGRCGNDPMPALAQLGGAARTIVVPIFAHVSVRARRSRRKKGCNGYALVQKTFCRKFSQWPRKAWDDELVHPAAHGIAALDATHLSRTFGPCGSCA